MADAFTEFLDRPGAETFLELRRAVIGSPGFDMFSEGLQQLEQMVDDGAHDAVPGLMPELMPNWLLNARTHSLLSQSAEARGDSGRATSEARMAEACMFGLKDTGDGSPDNPFAAIHAADEYDLVAFLGKQPAEQRREDRDGRAFDVLTCTDNSEVWFDITDGVVAMAERELAGE